LSPNYERTRGQVPEEDEWPDDLDAEDEAGEAAALQVYRYSTAHMP